MKKINIFIILGFVLILGACSNSNVQNTSIEGKESKIVSTAESKLERVNLNQFKQKLANKDSIIIDLRTTKELETTGIIENAIQIDYYGSDFKNKLNTLDKTKKILIYCRSGARSSNTLNLMKKLGFTNVSELSGGINAWLANGETTVSITSK